MRLAFREPLDADALITFFARRAVPGVEEVTGGAYRRSVRLPHGAGVVELRPGVEARLWLDDDRDSDAAVAHCRALFDLDTDPAPIAALQFPSSLPSGRVIASIATLALVCTALAFVLFFELIAEGGPVRGNLITYVNPAVAAVLGVLVLDERFTVGMGIGFVLVLAGSVLAAARTRQPVVAEP